MARPSRRFYDALHKQSSQHAVLVMLVFSIVALLSNLGLPYLVIPTTYTEKSSIQASHELKESPELAQKPSVQAVGIPQLWRIYLPTMPQAWMFSHIITSICLLGITSGNDFMTSVSFTSLLGVSWAFTQWAPFAIINAEIAKEAPLAQNSVLGSSTSSRVDTLERTGFDRSLELDQEEAQSVGNRLRKKQNKRAGIIMGIHNIAIALPQIISAVLSSLIYLTAKWLNIGELDAMACVLRVGVLAGGCAAYSAWV